MSNRKKILLAVPYFLLWIIYFMLTLNERNRYMMAENRGMDCIDSRDSGWIPGNETEFTYDPTKPPTRRYSTWGEFWKNKGY